jgi:hypothetical protein
MLPASGFICPQERRFIIKHDAPSYRPIGLVAARLFARRWLLYLLTSAAVFGMEALFYLYVHVPLSDFYAILIASPLISVVTIVFAGCDALGKLPDARERWGRIIERGWAVVVIDVSLTFLWSDAFGSVAGNTSDFLTVTLGVLVLIFIGMLVYAEPYACLEEHVRTLTLVPFAVLRSMMLAWVNMSRVFSLLAIQLAVGVLAALAHAMKVHDPKWIDLVLVAVTTAPLSVLFTVAYLDTLSQEQQAAP